MTKSSNRSTKKTFIAGAGLALMVQSTFAGAVMRLLPLRLSLFEYKGAVTAGDYGKSTYEISVDYLHWTLLLRRLRIRARWVRTVRLKPLLP